MLNHQIKQLTKPGSWLMSHNVNGSLCPVPEGGTVSASSAWLVFLPLGLPVDKLVVTVIKDSQRDLAIVLSAVSSVTFFFFLVKNK